MSLKIFLQLVTMTAGDVSKALSWLTNLDERYQLTDSSYGIGDFIDDLKKKGYIKEEEGEEQGEGEKVQIKTGIGENKEDTSKGSLKAGDEYQPVS